MVQNVLNLYFNHIYLINRYIHFLKLKLTTFLKNKVLLCNLITFSLFGKFNMLYIPPTLKGSISFYTSERAKYPSMHSF